MSKEKRLRLKKSHQNQDKETTIILAQIWNAAVEIDKERFKEKVLAAQIENAKKLKKVYCAETPDAEMDIIEGNFKMRTEAAKQCRALLVAARVEIEKRGDEEKPKVTSIGVHSAYRTYEEEKEIWERVFPQYYKTTEKKRQAAEGGIHGDRAVTILVQRFVEGKAAPGFSNHIKGIAVDFFTTEDGVKLKAESIQRDQWRASWFHRWLVAHAAEYKFEPLSSEEWHWNFSG